MKAEHIKFTEKALLALPVPTKADGAKTYYDIGCKDGLSLIITYGGSKTFYFFMFFQGRPIRVKLGKVGQLSLSDARKRAHSMREMANNGEDPTINRREIQKSITIKDFYYQYYKPRHADVFKKDNSRKSDDVAFRCGLSEIHTSKLISITHEDLLRLQNKLFKNGSPYTVNRAMSLLRHMYNKAMEWGVYPKKFQNPVIGIKKYKEKSRDRFMDGDEIKRFFTALAEDPNETFRNYVLLSLFLGQRRSNILAMRWSDIDFHNGLVYFPETKNGESLRIPLTTQAIRLLSDIRIKNHSEWVLPSTTSASGHYEEPKKSWRKLLERAGIDDLRLHDLRRTLGSYQAIAGSSLHIIGRSLGHKSPMATQVYARLSIDPVRESMQRATDKIVGFINGAANN